jgi:hypothetical protein
LGAAIVGALVEIGPEPGVVRVEIGPEPGVVRVEIGPDPGVALGETGAPGAGFGAGGVAPDGSGFDGAAGTASGLPPAFAVRTTRPFDHSSSAAHPSQRTTACGGPLSTDAGSALPQLGHADVALTSPPPSSSTP